MENIESHLGAGRPGGYLKGAELRGGGRTAGEMAVDKLLGDCALATAVALDLWGEAEFCGAVHS